LKCDCREINLNGMNLSEVRLLRLLERISQGRFTNLMTLMMVIAAKRVLRHLSDVFNAGWKWDRGQRRGDDRGGAEGQQQPADAPSCKAIGRQSFCLDIFVMERVASIFAFCALIVCCRASRVVARLTSWPLLRSCVAAEISANCPLTAVTGVRALRARVGASFLCLLLT
jgi:hypothetical protein